LLTWYEATKIADKPYTTYILPAFRLVATLPDRRPRVLSIYPLGARFALRKAAYHGTLDYEVPCSMSEVFMQRAIALAVENVTSGRGGPFGALIVKDDKIIAEGVNQVTAAHDPTAHAEIVAIREACRVLGDFQLTGCDLYTSCEPCPMCLGAIYWARPAHVFFGANAADAAAAGFDDAFIYEELRRPANQRRLPMKQLLRHESLAAFHAWVASNAKRTY
jgi:guanine deaminase